MKNNNNFGISDWNRSLLMETIIIETTPAMEKTLPKGNKNGLNGKPFFFPYPFTTLICGVKLLISRRK
ncbi:MAG: hypothetical protein H6566_10635 [Lewinellaceae bacterium]|nr:hypothetical protein [Lewinellaceae bacterium]